MGRLPGHTPPGILPHTPLTGCQYIRHLAYPLIPPWSPYIARAYPSSLPVHSHLHPLIPSGSGIRHLAYPSYPCTGSRTYATWHTPSYPPGFQTYATWHTPHTPAHLQAHAPAPLIPSHLHHHHLAYPLIPLAAPVHTPPGIPSSPHSRTYTTWQTPSYPCRMAVHTPPGIPPHTPYAMHTPPGKPPIPRQDAYATWHTPSYPPSQAARTYMPPGILPHTPSQAGSIHATWHTPLYPWTGWQYNCPMAYLLKPIYPGCQDTHFLVRPHATPKQDTRAPGPWHNTTYLPVPHAATVHLSWYAPRPLANPEAMKLSTATGLEACTGYTLTKHPYPLLAPTKHTLTWASS
jgi:hypothetical protein